MKSTKSSSSKSAKALSSGRASKITKNLAGNALTQGRTSKISSPELARKAARALANPNSTKSAKALAIGVLTQKNKDVLMVKSFRMTGNSLSQAERISAVRKAAAKK